MEGLNSKKAWLFLAPALVLMAVFTFYPLIQTTIYSFLEKYNGLDAAGGETFDLGFANYTRLFSNLILRNRFLTALKNTAIIVFLTVPLSLGLSLMISVALNSVKFLQKFFPNTSPLFALFRACLRSFLLFRSGEAEMPQHSAKGVIIAVGVGAKIRLFQVELAAFVQKAILDVHREDVGKEHIVRPERHHVGDAAADRDRALRDHGGCDLLGLDGGETAFFKLVHVTSALHSAEINVLDHSRCGKIDNKLTALLDKLIRISLGTNRNVESGGL